MSAINGNGWSLAKWEPPKPPDSLMTVPNHRLAFLARQEDFECVMLAEFGMAHSVIADATGLSKSQVSYRLRKLGISVMDFRNGRGPYARLVFEGLKRRAARQLTADLRMRMLDE